MMKLTQITDVVSTLTKQEGTESAHITLFRLFPGIYLGINDIHTHHLAGPTSHSMKYANVPQLRINYCFEGRCEVKLHDGRYVYVDNDVLCIEDHRPQYNFHYPLGFYKGIEIFIDKHMVLSKPNKNLEIFGIDFQHLIDKYCQQENTFLSIASDLFVQKATEIVSIWKNEALEMDAKIYQLRFALCQLLFYLIYDQAVAPDKSYNASAISHSQYLIAMDCEKRITADLSQKHTITDLAQNYKISPSSLKKFFSQVYGSTISEYLQTMRMKEASRRLINEDLSIMQVAASVGYENQSKFSAVFKKHTGYAPLEYKRIYTIKRNEEFT